MRSIKLVLYDRNDRYVAQVLVANGDRKPPIEVSRDGRRYLIHSSVIGQHVWTYREVAPHDAAKP